MPIPLTPDAARLPSSSGSRVSRYPSACAPTQRTAASAQPFSGQPAIAKTGSASRIRRCPRASVRVVPARGAAWCRGRRSRVDPVDDEHRERDPEHGADRAGRGHLRRAAQPTSAPTAIADAERAEQESRGGRERMRLVGVEATIPAGAYQAACDSRFPLFQPKTTTIRHMPRVRSPSRRRAWGNASHALWRTRAPTDRVRPRQRDGRPSDVERPASARRRVRARDRRAARLSSESRRSSASTSRSTPRSSRHGLPDGVHLVGHSYGGVIALLAAAAVPERVRSLTVIEPPATADRRAAIPAADAFTREGIEWWRTGPTDDPEAFLRGFLAYVGSDYVPPSPLGARARAGRADADRRARAVGGGDPARRRSPPRRSPTLVVSGGASRRLRRRLRRARRSARSGAARAAGLRPHGAAHPEFNERLAAFVLRAETPATG